MLIDAHAPKAHHFAFFVADKVRQRHELLFECVKRFVVVSLGKLGYKIKRIRLERFGIVFEGYAPMIAC